MHKILLIMALSMTTTSLFASTKKTGDKLKCFQKYQISHYNPNHKTDGGKAFFLKVASHDPMLSTENYFGGHQIVLDLKKISFSPDPQIFVATLKPKKKHSTSPIDIAFVPRFETNNTDSGLSRMEVFLGHVKKTKSGLIIKRKLSSRQRVVSSLYDSLYYSGVNVSLDLNINSQLMLNLPSIQAGIEDISLNCVVQ